VVHVPAFRRAAPDIINAGKSLAGGVSMGVLSRSWRPSSKLKPGTKHAATFGGNPLAARRPPGADRYIEPTACSTRAVAGSATGSAPAGGL